MSRFISLLGCVLCLNATAFDSPEFRYRKELKGRTESEALARFDLDSEVFRNTNDQFTDFRLVEVARDSEVEVPYLLSRVDRYVPPEPAKAIRTKVVLFEEDQDGSIKFEVHFYDTEKEKRCAMIDFRTPLRNFEKSVSVQGSVNGTDWEMIIDEALIFDHERFLDFRKTRLELPENEARFFKVRIAAATDKQRSLVRRISRTVGERTGDSVTETGTVTTRAFRIDSLRFLTAERDAEDVEDQRIYPVGIEKIVENEDTMCTEILIDTDRTPLTSFSIGTEDRNFRRDVQIQIPDGRERWRTFKRSRIYRYHIGNFQEEDLSVEFDSRRSEQFRILIENGDSPPLDIGKVIGKGDIHEALFFSEPDAEWAVYYGAINNHVPSPRYDTAALVLANGQRIAAERFTLGEERENPDFEGSLARPGWFDEKWVLWLVTALIVGGLIAILMKAGRKIQSIDH